jgi:L-lactate dehydrogenase (cytochrome)
MSRRLRSILSLNDLEPAASRHLPRPIFSYVAGGVEDGDSLRANRAIFQEYEFVPRILVDVSKRSTAKSLFGHTYSAPLGLAPMGISALTAYRGDVVLARAAAAADVPMIMSGSSLIRMEDVLAQSWGLWFQAYLPGDVPGITALIERVARAGFETLVLTLDTPVPPNRENNVRAGFSSPLRPSPRLAWDGLIRPRWLVGTFIRTLIKHGMPHFENAYAERGEPVMSPHVLRDFSDRGNIDWKHLELIRKIWPHRMVIKGILHRMTRYARVTPAPRESSCRIMAGDNQTALFIRCGSCLRSQPRARIFR